MATTKRVTAKSVICAGIIKGSTAAAILKQLAKKVPDSKADEAHVKSYAYQLFRTGDIDETRKVKYTKTRSKTKVVTKTPKSKSMPKAVKKVGKKKRAA